jgi:hypothetical protein
MEYSLVILCDLLMAIAYVGCVSSMVKLKPGAENVRFLSSASEAASCRFVRSISIHDGCVGTGAASSRDCDRERAINRLKNAALQAEADSVFLTKDTTSLIVDGPGGCQVDLEANAYACSSK